MFTLTTYLVIFVAIIFISDVLFGFGFPQEERHVVPAGSRVVLIVTLPTSPVVPSTPIGTQSELAGLMAVWRGFFLSHLIVMTVPSEIRLAVEKTYHSRRRVSTHAGLHVCECVYVIVRACPCLDWRP